MPIGFCDGLAEAPHDFFRRSVAAADCPRNRRWILVVRRLTGKENGVFDGCGKLAGRLRSTNRSVAICSSRQRVGLPVEGSAFDKQFLYSTLIELQSARQVRYCSFEN